MRNGSLSDFEDMWERLDAWGFQGRADACKPDPEAGTGSIYQMGRADRDGEGSELERAPGEPPRRMLTERQWETIDGYIKQLRGDRRSAICRHFYKRQEVDQPLLHESVRAMCDLEDANQAANRRMRG